MCRISLQDLSGGVSSFSRSPVARSRRPHFFDPNEVNTIAIGDRIEGNVFSFYVLSIPIGGLDRVLPSRIEKVRTAISCNRALREAGNTPNG